MSYNTDLPANNSFPIMRMNEFAASCKVPTDLVDGVISPKSLNTIMGQAKIGKSQLALQLAFCISNGYEFLGKRVEEGETIYVNYKLKPSDVLNRIESLKYYYNDFEAKTPYILNLYGTEHKGTEDDLIDIMDSCRDFIKEHPSTKLIVFDNLFEITDGECNSENVTKIYVDLLKTLTKQAAVVYLADSNCTKCTSNPDDVAFASPCGSMHVKLNSSVITLSKSEKYVQDGTIAVGIIGSKKETLICRCNRETKYNFQLREKEKGEKREWLKK